MKTKKIEYTCPGCKHKWMRNVRIYEGALWNEDEKQDRLCTAHVRLAAAKKHERMALTLRTQAHEILSRRASKKLT